MPRQAHNLISIRADKTCTSFLHAFVYRAYRVSFLGIILNPCVVMILMCRFWALVEPYCADITNEEIRLLEELLKPPDDEAEYYKVWQENKQLHTLLCLQYVQQSMCHAHKVHY